ncbi:uncharacterized protein KQ657_002467 [Scheffersomyces spartinae]|uniref:Uncharacterized protein n=1 Tax=Scheffersomyces spartinae TaxID=45513 RepID=A0A9P7V6I4_9ASCO|nr:uncharacterized protein KQ657_002467 [Scheffersomyces spartinae]KAG7192105.1 hypothetical protein KQ657_002467 [Scheffersomyces spartinae]
MSSAPQELESTRLLELAPIVSFMNGDSALDALLSRLKKSIGTGEEFAKYVKKRAQIEDEHYGLLKKFGNSIRMQYKKNQDALKNDSFSRSFDLIVGFDEELMNVGGAYVKALNVMYDELIALVGTVSRSRKATKEDAKRKEKDCLDAIQLAEKAQQKYYHLCDDLKRLRSSDSGKRTGFSLKNKSAEQQEEELQQKINAADQDYRDKVALCKKAKSELLLVHRPSYTKILKNLILEIDIAMNVQLQKFATWNENLIMKSGVLISPLQNTTTKKSMKQFATDINSEMDLYNYLLKAALVPPTNKLVPVEYKVHSSFANVKKTTTKPFLNNTSTGLASAATIGAGAGAGAGAGVGGAPPSNYRNTTAATTTNNNILNSSTTSSAPYPENFSLSNSHLSPAYSQSQSQPGPGYPTSPIDASFIDRAGTSPQNSFLRESPSSGPYSSLDPNASSGTTPIIGDGTFQNSATTNTNAPTHTRPTFGVSIEEVAQYAGVESVPLVVTRCIQVIEAHGLDLEFIYRTSGNKVAVEQMKREIDQNFANYVNIGNEIDSANVMDAQIHAVASLLKLYFAQLPEPLLTNDHIWQFLDTMKLQDESYKAKKLHHLVYSLPDGAYYTLRAILFHLVKVSAHKQNNKMSANALATVWWPALLHDDSNPEDVECKAKLIEELMVVAPDIFELDPEDE